MKHRLKKLIKRTALFAMLPFAFSATQAQVMGTAYNLNIYDPLTMGVYNGNVTYNQTIMTDPITGTVISVLTTPIAAVPMGAYSGNFTETSMLMLVTPGVPLPTFDVGVPTPAATYIATPLNFLQGIAGSISLQTAATNINVTGDVSGYIKVGAAVGVLNVTGEVGSYINLENAGTATFLGNVGSYINIGNAGVLTALGDIGGNVSVNTGGPITLGAYGLMGNTSIGGSVSLGDSVTGAIAGLINIFSDVNGSVTVGNAAGLVNVLGSVDGSVTVKNSLGAIIIGSANAGGITGVGGDVNLGTGTLGTSAGAITTAIINSNVDGSINIGQAVSVQVNSFAVGGDVNIDNIGTFTTLPTTVIEGGLNVGNGGVISVATVEGVSHISNVDTLQIGVMGGSANDTVYLGANGGTVNDAEIVFDISKSDSSTTQGAVVQGTVKDLTVSGTVENTNMGTGGAGALGVYVERNGTLESVTFDGLEVVVHGSSPVYGLYNEGTNKIDTINIDDLSVQSLGTTPSDAHGIYSRGDLGAITVDEFEVYAQSKSAYGITGDGSIDSLSGTGSASMSVSGKTATEGVNMGGHIGTISDLALEVISSASSAKGVFAADYITSIDGLTLDVTGETTADGVNAGTYISVITDSEFTVNGKGAATGVIAGTNIGDVEGLTLTVASLNETAVGMQATAGYIMSITDSVFDIDAKKAATGVIASADIGAVDNLTLTVDSSTESAMGIEATTGTINSIADSDLRVNGATTATGVKAGTNIVAIDDTKLDVNAADEAVGIIAGNSIGTVDTLTLTVDSTTSSAMGIEATAGKIETLTGSDLTVNAATAATGVKAATDIDEVSTTEMAITGKTEATGVTAGNNIVKVDQLDATVSTTDGTATGMIAGNAIGDITASEMTVTSTNGDARGVEATAASITSIDDLTLTVNGGDTATGVRAGTGIGSVSNSTFDIDAVNEAVGVITGIGIATVDTLTLTVDSAESTAMGIQAETGAINTIENSDLTVNGKLAATGVSAFTDIENISESIITVESTDAAAMGVTAETGSIGTVDQLTLTVEGGTSATGMSAGVDIVSITTSTFDVDAVDAAIGVIAGENIGTVDALTLNVDSTEDTAMGIQAETGSIHTVSSSTGITVNGKLDATGISAYTDIDNITSVISTVKSAEASAMGITAETGSIRSVDTITLTVEGGTTATGVNAGVDIGEVVYSTIDVDGVDAATGIIAGNNIGLISSVGVTVDATDGSAMGVEATAGSINSIYDAGITVTGDTDATGVRAGTFIASIETATVDVDANGPAIGVVAGTDIGSVDYLVLTVDSVESTAMGVQAETGAINTIENSDLTVNGALDATGVSAYTNIGNISDTTASVTSAEAAAMGVTAETGSIGTVDNLMLTVDGATTATGMNAGVDIISVSNSTIDVDGVDAATGMVAGSNIGDVDAITLTVDATTGSAMGIEATAGSINSVVDSNLTIKGDTEVTGVSAGTYVFLVENTAVDVDANGPATGIVAGTDVHTVDTLTLNVDSATDTAMGINATTGGIGTIENSNLTITGELQAQGIYAYTNIGNISDTVAGVTSNSADAQGVWAETGFINTVDNLTLTVDSTTGTTGSGMRAGTDVITVTDSIIDVDANAAAEGIVAGINVGTIDTVTLTVDSLMDSAMGVQAETGQVSYIQNSDITVNGVLDATGVSANTFVYSVTDNTISVTSTDAAAMGILAATDFIGTVDNLTLTVDGGTTATGMQAATDIGTVTNSTVDIDAVDAAMGMFAGNNIGSVDTLTLTVDSTTGTATGVQADTGAIGNISNSGLTVNGELDALGVYAYTNLGNISDTVATVTSASASAVGVEALTGFINTVDNLTLTVDATTGTSAMGMYAGTDIVSVTNSTLDIDANESATGMYAGQNVGTLDTVTLTVDSLTDAAMGVQAVTGMVHTIADSDITVNGELDATGVQAHTLVNSIANDSITVTSNSADAMGVLAQTSFINTVDNLALTVDGGANATGMLAATNIGTVTNSTVDVDAVDTAIGLIAIENVGTLDTLTLTVDSTGGGATGVEATTGAIVSVENSGLTVTGELDATGLKAGTNIGNVSDSVATVTSNSASAMGVQAETGYINTVDNLDLTVDASTGLNATGISAETVIVSVTNSIVDVDAAESATGIFANDSIGTVDTLTLDVDSANADATGIVATNNIDKIIGGANTDITVNGATSATGVKATNVGEIDVNSITAAGSTDLRDNKAIDIAENVNTVFVNTVNGDVIIGGDVLGTGTLTDTVLSIGELEGMVNIAGQVQGAVEIHSNTTTTDADGLDEIFIGTTMGTVDITGAIKALEITQAQDTVTVENVSGTADKPAVDVEFDIQKTGADAATGLVIDGDVRDITLNSSIVRAEAGAATGVQITSNGTLGEIADTTLAAISEQGAATAITADAGGAAQDITFTGDNVILAISATPDATAIGGNIGVINFNESNTSLYAANDGAVDATLAMKKGAGQLIAGYAANGGPLAVNIDEVITGYGAAVNAAGPLTLNSDSTSAINIVGSINVNGDLELSGATADTYSFDQYASWYAAGTDSVLNAVSTDLNGNTVYMDMVTRKTSDLIVSGKITSADDSAMNFVVNKMDAAYNFKAEDASVVNRFTLIGATYDNAAVDANGNRIANFTIEGELESNGQSSAAGGVDFQTKYLTGQFVNTGSNLSYVLTKNTFFADNVAAGSNNAANQSVFGNVLDGIISQDKGGAQDAYLADQFKKAFALDAALINKALPNGMSYAARQNIELAHLVDMDTLYRINNTRDYIRDLYERSSEETMPSYPLVEDVLSVGVRNINAYADYDGTSQSVGNSFYTYGGLAQLDYIYNQNLIMGLGVGGFYSKSSGKQSVGYAESTDIAVNAYIDYAFFADSGSSIQDTLHGLDWYLGLTYLHGMNDAYRYSAEGEIKNSFDSDTVSLFTGFRYTFKPFEDEDFYVKPIVGLDFTAYITPSSTEDGNSTDRCDYDSRDNYSLRAIAGVEMSYKITHLFFANFRALYSRETMDGSYDVDAYWVNSHLTNTPAYTMRGAPVDRDTGIFGVGLSTYVAEDMKVHLDYNVQVGEHGLSNNLNAGFSWQF